MSGRRCIMCGKPCTGATCRRCDPTYEGDHVLGAYWLGILGAVLAAPAATERCVAIVERARPRNVSDDRAVIGDTEADLLIRDLTNGCV